MNVKRLAGFLLAAVILVPAMIGFGNKFLEFLILYAGDADGAFALSPIMNYLLAALGFFCLFCWAAFQGMFRDVEQPKRDFLEIENQLDQYERCRLLRLQGEGGSGHVR